MSLTEIFAGAPYRSNDSGIRACRDEALEAWKLELTTDAQLLLPIVARRWALALTAPLVILSCFVGLVAWDFVLLGILVQLALPAFLVLSWAARVVLAARLARPLRESDDPLADLRRLAATSPLEQLVNQAARLAPWSRSAAMILGALVVPLVPPALMPLTLPGERIEGVLTVAGIIAVCGLWLLPALFLRSFQIGFASQRRGGAPLTSIGAVLLVFISVAALLFWLFCSLMGGYLGPLVVLAGGGVIYFPFWLAQRILRRRTAREDALIAALLRRRAA